MVRSKGEVTIKDVAEAAGVGLGTVSRVLNNKAHVRDASRQRVLAAIETLGYRPNLVARSMRAGESKTLAFVVRDFASTILSALAEAVQREVDVLGFSLFVASSYFDTKRELALVEHFSSRRVDGLMIATSSESDEAYLAALRSNDMPIVLLDRAIPAEMDAVQADHAHGVSQAIDHLVALGHRRIAMITGEPDVFPTSERLRGYREALARHAIPLEPAFCRLGSYAIDFACDQARAMMSDASRPTAIITGGTALLPAVMRGIQQAGLRIPHDVSVVAVADSDLARFANPPVTVIHWDYEAFGRTAGRFLLNRLSVPDRPLQRRLFPMTLVVRASCAPPPRA